jgi:F0F1-type ATP synthase assembly protein I
VEVERVAHNGVRGQLDSAGLAERRELNNGAGDALAVAFELALTPAIFAFLGWLLDRWLGTGPIFLLVLFGLVALYEIWKLLSRYDAEMKDHEQKLRGRRSGQGPSR